MQEMVNKKELDNLFLKIFNDLLQQVIETSDTAAERILELSSHLITADAQETLATFHKLYTNNDVDQIKYDFNKQIDQILETGQGIDNIHDHPGAELANLQLKLEKLINTNDELRAHISPIMSAVQFSEFLHRHILSIEQAWEVTINQINETSDHDLDTLALEIEGRLSTKFERKAFNRHVLKRDIILETDEDIDHILDSILQG
jgi:hypothetical protein